MFYKANIFLITLISLLFITACNKKEEKLYSDENLYSSWLLASEQAEVELLIRSNATFNVNLISIDGIEIEGKLELEPPKITFINTHGTDSISSDPRPGIYTYSIHSDTLRFELISDPSERRAGFLALPRTRKTV
ncbi:MAG: hypothetical protein KJ578_10335 [Bacteroidetes bacterium]|nr:hypothetical protein [Bacteroidota bacterium]MBU1580022.1 hypothetical protein [Bacteroidota bacterium]MBU2464892.1 hypothetical protein [Bacteroidota bacterium]MBU2558163.1 hypothetical protein [Bacteroidota bacterium]